MNLPCILYGKETQTTEQVTVNEHLYMSIHTQTQHSGMQAPAPLPTHIKIRHTDENTSLETFPLTSNFEGVPNQFPTLQSDSIVCVWNARRAILWLVILVIIILAACRRLRVPPVPCLPFLHPLRAAAAWQRGCGGLTAKASLGTPICAQSKFSLSCLHKTENDQIKTKQNK